MSEIGPKIPNFIDQIQFITYYIGNPCDVPFMGYIETALPISGEIALTLLGIDLQTFLKRTFRPKWVRSGRHTRRGPRGRKGKGGIPEPAEVIADILDPDRSLAVNKWPMGTYMLLEAWEIVDRVFWTLFLFEMVDSLLINSIIGAIELKTTDCPNIPRFARSGDFAVGGGAEPVDNPVNVPTLLYSVGMPAQAGTFCFLPPGRFVVVFSGALRSSYPGMIMQPAIVQTLGGNETRKDGPLFVGGDNEWNVFTVSMTVTGGGNMQWRVRRGDGFYNISNFRIFIIKTGD